MMIIDPTVKQVAIILQGSPMSKQDLCVGCGTAFTMAQEKAQETHHGWWERWMRGGHMKIVLKCPTQELYDSIFSKAVTNHLPFATFGNRIMVIGCAPSAEIDKLTYMLKLL